MIQALPAQPGAARGINKISGRLDDFLQRFRMLSLAASKPGGDIRVDCGGSAASNCRQQNFSVEPKTKVGTRCGKHIIFFPAGLIFSGALTISEMRLYSFDFAPQAAAQTHSPTPTEE
jgi:hypothetical protein